MTTYSDKVHGFVTSLLAYGYVLHLERDPDQDVTLFHEYHMLTEQDAQECTNKLLAGASLHIFSREEWEDSDYREACTHVIFDRDGQIGNIREFLRNDFIHQRILEVLR